MVDENNDRGFILYKEFRKSLKSKFMEYDRKEKEISLKFKTLNDKFRTVTDKQCEQPLRNLSQINEAIDPESYKKTFKSVEDCYTIYDFGLKDEMERITKRLEVIDDDSYNCNKQCMENISSKIDEDIKKCYGECYDSSFILTTRIQNNLLSKINENMNKLAKM